MVKKFFVVLDDTNPDANTGIRLVVAETAEEAWEQCRLTWTNMPPFGDRDDSDFRIAEKTPAQTGVWR